MNAVIPGFPCRYMFVMSTHTMVDQLADHETWLSHKEFSFCQTIRSSEYKKNWLAGRFLAKTMIRDFGPHREVDLGEIEIVTSDDANRGCPPKVLFRNNSLHCSISISHTDRYLAVAMINDRISLGIDLVETKQSGTRFDILRSQWFTKNEKKQVPPGDKNEIARRWALKEAVYKFMCHRQRGFAPLDYEILRSDNHSDPAPWKIMYCETPLSRLLAAKTFESSDCVLGIVLGCHTEVGAQSAKFPASEICTRLQ